MTIVTTWAAGSATGFVRPLNEDSAYAGRWLYAVADGMGGHVAGEVASAAAVRAVVPYDVLADPSVLVESLGHAVGEANAAIRRYTEADPTLRTMGTTFTAMLWSGHAFALAHIGDSRAYRLRSGQLRQLTEDHILRNLVSGTRTSPVLAPVLSRYLDGTPGRSPDLGLREACPGDRYLLCSDGLTPVVPDDGVRDVLRSADEPTAAVAELAGLANSAGAPDNVTVIVIDVSPAPVPEKTPVILGAAAEIPTGTVAIH
jgi:PPM family protein phosphatase